MNNETAWHISQPIFPKLEQSGAYDVAIIGGGITGLLCTHLLTEAGYKVILLEKNRLGSGATYLTTAFLTQMIDTDLSDLAGICGNSGTRQIFDSHGAAIDLVEHIVNKESIDCEFIRCANYIYGNKPKDYEKLEKEYQLGKSLGLPLGEISRSAHLGIKCAGHFELKNQAKFHPLKFIIALAEMAKGRGAEIYEDTEVDNINTDNELLLTTVRGQQVKAQWIISAAYQPFGKPPGLFFKKGQYDTYILELEAETGHLPEAIFEDTDNPYHYFRVDKQKHGDRVIIGGEDHRSDVPASSDKAYQALIDYTEQLLAEVPHKIVRKWGGPILEPADGLAYIGPYKHDRVLYTTGFSGNGMTYAGIAALMFTDMIRGNENNWRELYRAARMPSMKSLVVKGRDYFHELFNGAVRNALKY